MATQPSALKAKGSLVLLGLFAAGILSIMVRGREVLLWGDTTGSTIPAIGLDAN